jgi:hypothetical protein
MALTVERGSKGEGEEKEENGGGSKGRDQRFVPPCRLKTPAAPVHD